MKQINKEELKTILENHSHWLREDCEGWENMRADLSYCDLDHASLDHASLNGASLNGASLNYASLNGASLNGASLNGASLNYASLDHASLNGASLDHASLNGASLKRASLDGASLDGAKNIPFVPHACPSDGAFVGWKRVRGDLIIKLLIPEDAKRLSSTGRKCRCDKAVVLEIQNADGTDSVKNVAYSMNNPGFIYTKGETVIPDSFDDNRWNECSHGIHFFTNRQEAVDYK